MSYIIDEKIIVLDGKEYRAYLKKVPVRLGKEGIPIAYAIKPFIRKEGESIHLAESDSENPENLRGNLK